MARLTRLEAPGRPHLIVQAGHNGAAISLDDADRAAYRDALRLAVAQDGVAVHAYAIGTRRVLLLVTPHAAGALGQLMQRIGRRYTTAFNARHRRTGTLWDGRYGTAVVEAPGTLLSAMRLLDAEADRAGLLTSRAVPRGEAADALITPHPAYWSLGNTPFEREAAYRLLADAPLSAEESGRLEHSARHGWAVGGEAFLANLQRELGRPVRPRAAGRPRLSAHHSAHG